MNVSGLQQHLGDLANLLRASQAAKVATDLEAIRDGLTPFVQLSLPDFAGFLARCEEFARTGQVSASAKSTTKGTRAPAKPKAPKPTPSQLAEETKNVFERAGTASVADEEIEALVVRLNSLQKPGIIEVAAAIDLPVKKSATKGVLIDEIKRWIVQRQGSKLRSEMTQPPPPQVHADEPEVVGEREGVES